MSGQGRAFLGVSLVFLLGCAAGILAASVFFAHRETLFFQRGGAAYLEVVERRFTRGVNLDADQRTEIHGMFMSNLAERKRLQKQIQPQVQALNFETYRQIKSILHPDQLETFNRNVSEFRRRFARQSPSAPSADAPSLNESSTNSVPDQPAPNP